LVTDQDGKPLPGVKISLSVRQWQYAPPLDVRGSFPKTRVSTDSKGRFEFTEGKGDVLTIDAMEKDGYEPEPGALRNFGYNVSENVTPDPNGPVVFRMWQTGTHQTLVTGDKFYAIWPDGRTYTLDLLNGTKSESPGSEGDLRVRVVRPSDVKLGQKYDWSFSVEAINGGIIEETDPRSAMYIAPADGYVPIYELGLKADDQNWGYRVTKRFYTRTRGGANVGRISLDVFAFYDPNSHDGTLGIKYAINPTGSRILRP
jgi:hypothetical protein